MRVWLKAEVFEYGALQFPPRSGSKLTFTLIVNAVKALQEADATTVRRTNWIKIAGDYLDWAECEAQLFWEQLELLYSLHRPSNALVVERVAQDLPLCGVTLFIFVHLFDKTLVLPNKISLAAVWPPEEPINSPGASPSPSKNNTRSPGSSPLSCNSPRSPRSPSMGQSPSSSPRAVPASRATVEAQRLSFAKQHLTGLFQLLASSADVSPIGSLAQTEVDALGFLFAGGPSFQSQVSCLGSLVPCWADDWNSNRTGHCEPVSSITEWFATNITINEVAYPPPAPPLHHSAAAGFSGLSDRSIASSRSSNDVQREGGNVGADPDMSVAVCAEKTAKLLHDTAQITCPLVLNGLMKCTVVKDEKDFASSDRGTAIDSDLRVQFCQDCFIYVLAPVRFATILGCENCTIVVGAVAGVVKTDHCENVNIITSCHRIRISNCLDSTFNLFTTSSPLLSGDNRAVSFGPFNTSYLKLQDHLKSTRLEAFANAVSTNRWDVPVCIQASAKDVKAISAFSLVPPVDFRMILIPVPDKGVSGKPVVPPGYLPLAHYPFTLPPSYCRALEHKKESVQQLRAEIRKEGLSQAVQSNLEGAVQAQFREWLMKSGNVKQVLDLVHTDS